MPSQTTTTTAARPSPAAGGSARGRITAYARLAKLDIIDYYLGLVVVWSLLAPAAWLAGRTVVTLLVILLGELLVVAAMVALDDVTGYRDGSDATNYGPDAPARRLARKPLLAGTLTEPQALRFAALTAGAGVLVWALAVAVAPHRPLWAIVLAAGCLIASVQYSWGIKLSYRGGQEIFLVGLGVGWVLAPYGLLAGDRPGFAVVQAVLFGLGPLLFGVYSNTNDIAGDRSVGRITVSTRASARGNTAFIAAVSASETGLIILAAATGLAPWWFPLVMLPTIAVRIAQAVTGLVRGDILAARRLGIRAHRLTVALLVVSNLLAAVLTGGF